MKKTFEIIFFLILFGLHFVEPIKAQQSEVCDTSQILNNSTDKENCENLFRSMYHLPQSGATRNQTVNSLNQSQSHKNLSNDQWASSISYNATNYSGHYSPKTQTQSLVDVNYKIKDGDLFSLIMQRDYQSKEIDGIGYIQLQKNITPLLNLTTKVGFGAFNRYDPQFVAKIAPQYSVYYDLKSTLYAVVASSFQFSNYQYGTLLQFMPSFTIGLGNPSISLTFSHLTSQTANITATSAYQLNQPAAVEGFQYTLGYQPNLKWNLSFTFIPVNTSLFYTTKTRETAFLFNTSYQLSENINIGINYQTGWVNYSPLGRLYNLNNIGAAVNLKF
jgi:hypothetical protein